MQTAMLLGIRQNSKPTAAAWLRQTESPTFNSTKSSSSSSRQSYSQKEQTYLQCGREKKNVRLVQTTNSFLHLKDEAE
ncbi:unnamed protein product, partial [Ceratitis capitata]